MTRTGLGWVGIVRLGLVQSAIGAVVVLTTATFNRVMVVEMALPASLPAALVAWHYVLQLTRPHWGHGSDAGNNRTPWIVFGMGLLALGAILAANATVAMAAAPGTISLWGIVLGLIAFAMIGAGVAAAGTSLLALLATKVAPERRPAAAAITWVMMILGIVVTAGVAGHALDPYSAQRLVLVASGVAGISFLLALVAVRGVEDGAADPKSGTPEGSTTASEPALPFGTVMRQIWNDRLARNFTIFVFVSMLAYSAQELIVEPYAGLVFGYTIGKSTQLAGFQHGGVLIGMILVGLIGSLIRADRTLWMKRCTLLGCAASAVALLGLAAAGFARPVWPLPPMVFALGFANGVFAVSAIGLMMSFAGRGAGGVSREGAHTGSREGAHTGSREGAHMGLWGAAQAGAFAIGGFIGASGVDLLRHAFSSAPLSFALVFCGEALLFLAAAGFAARLHLGNTARSDLVDAGVDSDAHADLNHFPRASSLKISRALEIS